MKLQKNRLSKLGGLDAKAVAKNIIAFVFTKEAGKFFSWDGKKGNSKLKDTPIGKAMLGIQFSAHSM